MNQKIKVLSRKPEEMTLVEKIIARYHDTEAKRRENEKREYEDKIRQMCVAVGQLLNLDSEQRGEIGLVKDEEAGGYYCSYEGIDISPVGNFFYLVDNCPWCKIKVLGCDTISNLHELGAALIAFGDGKFEPAEYHRDVCSDWQGPELVEEDDAETEEKVDEIIWGIIADRLQPYLRATK